MNIDYTKTIQTDIEAILIAILNLSALAIAGVAIWSIYSLIVKFSEFEKLLDGRFFI